MSTPSEAVIMLFKDSVSKEQVEKYADDIVENGGIVKDRYWESPVVPLNGFSAIIPVPYLANFKNLQGSDIKSIEGDGIVTTQ